MRFMDIFDHSCNYEFDWLFLAAHMWYDATIIEADTTEDQSGGVQEKVKFFVVGFVWPSDNGLHV